MAAIAIHPRQGADAGLMEALWIAIAFAAFSVIAMSRTRVWPLELLSHFRPHLIAVGLVLIAISSACQWYGAVALACLAVIANALTFPKLHYRLPVPAGDPGRCVLWANLWKRESALERTITYAREQGADVLLLAEFPDLNADWLAQHAADYPHRLISEYSAAPFTTCVAILSTRPFEQSQTTLAAPLQSRPLQSVSVRCGDGLLHLSAAHPAAPGTPQMLRDRDAAFRMVFEREVAPSIVGGDFNATPWCEALRGAPTRIGNPLLESTWLTRFPLIGLPIDHLFISEGLGVSFYRVGPFLGSDHRALIARVHV